MAAILIIEDEHALGTALYLAIQRLGHTPVLAASGGAALEKIKAQKFDALVLDIGLPDVNGLEILEKIRSAGSNIPIVIITAHATLDHIIHSQKWGVAEYLIKPLDLTYFEEVISSLVTKQVSIPVKQETRSKTLIGTSVTMQQVFRGVARACDSKLPVLIYGASGTGKSLAAQVIHSNSSWKNEPIRIRECKEIDDLETLQLHLEDTTGTLVLEEIEALSPTLQTFLAEKIAVSDASLPRLIATLKGSPSEAEVMKKIRSDLFYAFNSLTISMPSLKERMDDLMELCQFLYGLQNQNHLNLQISASAIAAIQAYEWPGNIRELSQVLEYASAMSHGSPILVGHLPPQISSAWQGSLKSGVTAELDYILARWIDLQLELTEESQWRYQTLLEPLEAFLLKHLLQRFENRPTRLATAMQINRVTLRQKLRRLTDR